MFKKCVAIACSLLVGAVMIASFAGCGGDSKPAANPATPPAPANDHGK
jgi:hypothetical protein